MQPNKSILNCIAAFILSLSAIEASAVPITLGFEGIVAPGGATIPITPYTEAGFILTNSQGAAGGSDGIFDSASGVNTNGTDIFGWCATCGPLTITLAQAGGGAFNLLSFDSALLDLGAPDNTLAVTANFLGGASSTVAVTQTSVWTTELLGFVGVSSVDFDFGAGHNASNHAFDNLVVDAASIPEPASIALFGLGMLGLGLLSKRKQA